MSEVESGVVDAAKYLRSIRPIDPDELVEYVPEAGDATAVRSILRDRAFDLVLIERDDGLFEPAPTDAVRFQGRDLTALPTRFVRMVDRQLVDRFGDDWASGRSGERLRARVDRLKRRYLKETTSAYDELDGFAYLLYHAPRSYLATREVLAEVTARRPMHPPLRILDVGAGVGANLAAVADSLDWTTLVRYDTIEPSSLAERCACLADAYPGSNVHVSMVRDPIEDVDLVAEYDLVMLGNVLSELANPEAIAATTMDHLDAKGAWVAVAPADPRTSVQLYEIERSLVPPATAYAPMLRLWPNRQPRDDCWSFVERPIDPPQFQVALRREAEPAQRERYATDAARYAYTILRRDGLRRFDLGADPSRFMPLGDIERAIGERVDVIAVKLSHDLAQEDGNPLVRIGDGSQSVDCFAVCVNSTALNRELLDAPYGAVVTLEGALVLWNDDEAAINLVADEQTIVERRSR